MPLLYVILKYAKGDLEEASKQLFEGKHVIQPLLSISFHFDFSSIF